MPIKVIEEKNPLKQGLKLDYANGIAKRMFDWREESIKTRIETTWLSRFPKMIKYWREESIKTRIETFSPVFAVRKSDKLKRRIH